MSYPLSNVIVDSMPEADRYSFSEQLKQVALPVGTSLYEPNVTPRYVHFLTSGIASIVAQMEDGSTTEVGTVGREGLPEGVHLLGPASVSTRCFMQISGTAMRMQYRAFERLFHAEETLRRSVLAYAQYQSVLLGQVAGCNRLHGVEGRLARWLLMVEDRTGNTAMKLTQEFLGQMIGTQRTTVQAVASALQGKGLILYSRGTVKILDRTGLKEAACECYAITRRLLTGLYKSAGQTVFGGAFEEDPVTRR